MVAIKLLAISLFSGVLLGGGWWAFFDGVVYAPDAFPWFHIVPPLLATVSFICLNLITFEQLKERTDAKVWMFAWMTVSCLAVGGAIWITAVEYPPTIKDNWPGVAIILQTTLVLLSAVLFFVGRSFIEQ